MGNNFTPINYNHKQTGKRILKLIIIRLSLVACLHKLIIKHAPIHTKTLVKV